MKLTSAIGIISLGLSMGLAGQACSASASGDGDGDSGDGDLNPGDGDGGIGDGDVVVGDGDVGDGDGDDNTDPTTCEQAAANKTYIGCEFWPTVTYNKVHEGFAFAVVLANGGAENAKITVTGGALAAPLEEEVPAGGLRVVELPWVPALKGPIWAQSNTSGGRDAATTVRANAGAYRVVSDLPVTAWQFNPLDYQKAGVTPCYTQFNQPSCFSVSNDASILVPSTALTGNYRVYTFQGDAAGEWGSMSGGIAITATADNTNVTVQFGPNCEHGNNGNPGTCTTGVDGMPKAPGAIEEFTLNAGDVVQYIGTRGANDGLANADMSGSVIEASAPVQVIAENPLANIPDSAQGHGNADHLEEIIMPAQVIGKEYVVPAPTSPNGAVKGGHVVKIVGNVDGTTLTYENQPAGAPTTLAAGQIATFETDQPFKVSGNEPFALTSIMYGGWKQGSDGACSTDPIGHPCSGDPAISMAVTPEQFRTTYTFLAPITYDINFADILIPDGAEVTLNGNPVTGTEPVVAGWTIARVPLDAATGGSHRLKATAPVGLQVMGFGHATSYYYPGGLNLKIISPPPPIVR